MCLLGHLICQKCNVPLELLKTDFTYLRHQFSEKVPRCPKCGMAYIDEKLVQEKMIPVEQLVEEK